MKKRVSYCGVFFFGGGGAFSGMRSLGIVLSCGLRFQTFSSFCGG